MSKTSIVLMIGTLVLLVLIFFLLKTGQFSSSETIDSDPGQTNGTIGQQDIIHTDLPILEDVTVTRIPTAGPLENLVPNPSTQFSKIVDLFWPNEIYTFECRGGYTKYGRTILFTALYTQDPKGNNFRAAIEAVEEWEPQVAREVGPLLYPAQANVLRGVGPSEFVAVPDTDYKKTTFTLGGEQYELYYSWLLNNVLFSTSQECLDAAVFDFYAPYAH